MQEASHDQKPFEFHKLQPLEVHDSYRLDRLLALDTSTKVNRGKSLLDVTLSYDMHPVFRKLPLVDGYRITVIGIFPDLKRRTAKTEVAYSKMLVLSGKPAALTLHIPLPPRTTTFLVCVRVDGCIRGKNHVGFPAKGMKITASGALSR